MVPTRWDDHPHCENINICLAQLLWQSACQARTLATMIPSPYGSCLFCVWGFLKEKAYRNNPINMQDLKRNSEQAVAREDHQSL
jgi:hypothetical protein